jgi:D-aspartate ligase
VGNMGAAVDTSRPVVVLDPGDVGFGVARSLGRLGVPVYGVHADPGAPGAHSRYWRGNYTLDTTAASPDYTVAWLLDLAARIGGEPILIATDDTSCLLVAERTVELQTGFLFPEQPPGLTAELSSKAGMYRLCKQFGIPTPETVFPQSRSEVEEFARSATYPVMVKGIFTFALQDHAGVRMLEVYDSAQLLTAYDRLETPGAPNVMLQEYVPGGTDAVWMFDGYFDRESRCLFGIAGKKIRQYPAYTGRTSLGICLENSGFTSQVVDFMRRLGYRGILDIGYKFDARTGEYKLLDVNPRLGMSFRLFVDRSGMDVARALYLDLTDQPVPAGGFPEGRKWLVEDIDALSARQYGRDGKLSLREWLGSFRRVEETCWLAGDDLSPAWHRLVRAGQQAAGRYVARSERRRAALPSGTERSFPVGR